MARDGGLALGAAVLGAAVLGASGCLGLAPGAGGEEEEGGRWGARAALPVWAAPPGEGEPDGASDSWRFAA